jgi:hypothetical protein
MGCLYQLIFPNGKSYIGITKKTAEQRFQEHCLNSKNGITEVPNQSSKEKDITDKKYGLDNFGRLPWLTLLGKAIREFGKENVAIITLVIASDMEFLKELEIKAISRYRTLDNYGTHHSGYNTSRGNCPKEIDWVARTKNWRVTLTPRFDWPPNYFKNEAIYIAEFHTLGEARRVYEEILSEEARIWRETIYAEWLEDPNCHDGYYKRGGSIAPRKRE